MRVLVIEDNPIDLKLMRAVLQLDGHEAREHTAAEGAFEVIRSYRPDVILIDLNLPGVDGLALVRELQQCRDTSHIPIVAVTAYPFRYHGAEVVAAGCSACIVKPIDTRELGHQLRAIAKLGVVAGRGP
jgi:CheY-like chemotaxis protein